MSLISFATGGLFGLGYGKSIHKYMNFPNPTTDFILPVVVEELGLVFGFIPIIVQNQISSGVRSTIATSSSTLGFIVRFRNILINLTGMILSSSIGLYSDPTEN